MTEFQAASTEPRFFKNLKIDLNDFQLKEVNFGKLDDIFATSSAHIDSYGNPQVNIESEESKIFPPRTCEPIKLKFCRQIGYNMTTLPNLLGHQSHVSGTLRNESSIESDRDEFHRKTSKKI